MGTFNYTQLHIFNKKGDELPIKIISPLSIIIPSDYNDDAVFYPLVDNNGSISFIKKSSGSRFKNTSTTRKCFIRTERAEYATTCEVTYSEPYTSSEGEEYFISELLSVNYDFELSYPNLSISASCNLGTLSTGLVETESFYILTKNDEGELITLGECDETWSNRYDILFFIDCREQQDFRFFTVSNDEVVWSNKTVLDPSQTDETGCRVDLGFTSEEEGIFKETIYICLLDRGAGKNIPVEEADITCIGKIIANAETIGEDERYRALFANFGIPDPIEYPEIFRNTSSLEDKIDNIILNENSKKMFLTYSEIFPYVGTYKALINAIKLLEYDDIFFKEWYKKIDNKNGGYVTYDMSYEAGVNANIINNTSMEERIKLKKLNWISMMYKLSEEVTTVPADEYGFPAVISKYSYITDEFIVKLIALREWLQKYIVGLNCRIIDIGGEGIVFERYALAKYGTYETVLEWNNEHNIAPYIVAESDNILQDSSTLITANVGIDDTKFTLEDIKNARFEDFCDGYFLGDTFYFYDDPGDASIFTGKTLLSFTSLDDYMLRASSKCENFSFGDMYLDASSASLRIDGDSLYMNPLDIHNGKESYSNFEALPLIEIKKGIIRNTEGNPWDSSNKLEINNIDYVALRPLEGQFIYKEDDYMGYPAFFITNYDLSLIDDSSSYFNLNDSSTYAIDLLDGKLLFTDDEKTTCINFSYDASTVVRTITANVTYMSDIFNVKVYVDEEEIPAFANGESYEEFVKMYDSSTMEAIKYNFEYSLQVYNAGEYTVDVIGFDLQNNTFVAKCSTKAVVGTPDIKIGCYTNNKQESSVLASIEELDKIRKNYVSYCIYNKAYPVTDFDIDLDASSNLIAVSYDKSTMSQDNVKPNDYIHFKNNVDKFKCISIESNPITSAHVKDSSAIFNEYFLVLEKEYSCPERYAYFDENSKEMIDSETRELTGRKFLREYSSLDMFKNTYTDVNVILYNELGNYPMYQSYGAMCKTKDENGKDIYELLITEYAGMSYIWANADSLTIDTWAVPFYKRTDNPSSIVIPLDSSLNNIESIFDSIVRYVDDSSSFFDASLNDTAYQLAAIDLMKDVILPQTIQIPRARLDEVDPTIIANLVNEWTIVGDTACSRIYRDAYKKELNELFTSEIVITYVTLPESEEDEITVENYRALLDATPDVLAGSPELGYIFDTASNIEAIAEFEYEPSILDACIINSVAAYVDNDKMLYNATLNSYPNILKYEDNKDLLEAAAECFDSNMNPQYGNIDAFVIALRETGKYTPTDMYRLGSMIVYMNLCAFLIKELRTRFAADTIFTYIESVHVDEMVRLNDAAAHGLEYFFSPSDKVNGFTAITDILHNADLEGNIVFGRKLVLNGSKYFLAICENDSNWITSTLISKTDPSLPAYYYVPAYMPNDSSIGIRYLKDPSYLGQGYDCPSLEAPEFYMLDVAKLVASNAVSIYIQPTYKLPAIVTSNNADGTLNVNINTDIVNYHFNGGDMIKLMYNSVTNEDYMAQASYEVIENENAPSNVLTLRGQINEAYIRTDKGFVFWVLPKAALEKEYSSTDSVVKSLKEFIDESGKKRHTVILNSSTNKRLVPVDTFYINGNVLVKSYMLYIGDEGYMKYFALLPNDKDNFNTSEEFSYSEIVNGLDLIGDQRARIQVEINEPVNMYVSYAHHAYVDYVLPAVRAYEDFDINSVYLPYTNDTMKYLTFVDSTFNMTSSDFNIDLGIYAWMDPVHGSTIANPLAGTPNILASGPVYRTNGVAVGTPANPNAVFYVENIPSTSYPRWRVYNHYTASNERELLFESYNKTLYIDYPEKGIYDIEVTVFDEFGNASVRMFDGAYQVL